MIGAERTVMLRSEEALAASPIAVLRLLSIEAAAPASAATIVASMLTEAALTEMATSPGEIDAADAMPFRIALDATLPGA